MTLWDRFTQSGRVEDYLAYANSGERGAFYENIEGSCTERK